MQNNKSIILKDLVLVGGGHSHVTVLKQFAMTPLSGVRLTLISRDIHTPYSGMLPGLIAGHYNFDQTHIDLGPLACFAGAQLYHDEVTGLDLEKKLLQCRNRPSVSYDLLSVNIGSTPTSLPNFKSNQNIVAVKPIGSFISRWEQLKKRVRNSSRNLNIGVVGAGAGGVELILSVQYSLRNLLNKYGRARFLPKFHLFSDNKTILPTYNQNVQNKFCRILSDRRVKVHVNFRVAKVRPGSLISDEGNELDMDEVLWVTEAGAALWLKDSGIDLNSSGFIKVQDTLESTSHQNVFATGDVAAMVNHPRYKSGVIAVRQGKPLYENLCRRLSNTELKPFVPQKKFLSLISTGDQYAIASRGNWALEGHLVWKWKDWIDRRFVRQYNELPNVSEHKSTQPNETLVDSHNLQGSSIGTRCGGCGAKVGADILNQVLSQLSLPKDRDNIIGLSDLDDSAVSTVPPGKVIVQSVDFFRALMDDPYTFGKITATHCLSDIFAMAAEPRFALSIAVIPYGTERKTKETLEQLLLGCLEVLHRSGTSLIGGHTSEGVELSLGLSITGFADPNHILRKRGMQPGDSLILTKPLGTGSLFAAHMCLKAKGRWILHAIDEMLQSNQEAANCLYQHGATACTDVTGFGLLGHLLEMNKASNTNARLFLEAIPLMEGVKETMSAGIFSSLHPHNLRLRSSICNLDELSTHHHFPILFDPQTSGGLLASVPVEKANRCLGELKKLGYSKASLVGTIEPMSGGASIRIETSTNLE